MKNLELGLAETPVFVIPAQVEPNTVSKHRIPVYAGITLQMSLTKISQFLILNALQMGLKDAVIVGYDAISPLGSDLEVQWQRALEGKNGIGPLTRFSLTRDFPVRIAGQVPDINDENYPFFSARHQAAWSSPVFKYSMLSVARALKRSRIEISPDISPRVAVTYSSAIGGLDAVLTADRRLQTENKLPHLYANPNSCINMVGGKIAIQTGARGPITSTITACATGLTSMIIGAMFLTQDRADVAI